MTNRDEYCRDELELDTCKTQTLRKKSNK